MACPKKLVAAIVGILVFFVISFIPNRIADKPISIEKKPGHQIVILPHLDTAKSARVKLISTFSEPSDVIVLSTNHFNSSDRKILYSNDTWNLEKGAINNTETVPIESSFDDEELIKADHGIRNVITDLANNFAKANYHSYLIKDSIEDQSLKGLEDRIFNYCEQKSCLIVGSVDFSHYNPSAIADLHDSFAKKALQKKDFKDINKLEVDSTKILSLITRLADKNYLNSFEVYENSNTGKLTGDFDSETTSWVIGRFVAEAQTAEDSVQLMFAGDIMMDRLVDARFKNNFDNLFSDFKNRVFGGVDASIANFEGPLNDGPVQEDTSVNNLVFNFPLASADALKKINLSGFTLANNHTLNDGADGLARTRKLLEQKGFFSFGSPNGLDENSLKILNTKPKVALIGVNTLLPFSEPDLMKLIQDRHGAGEYVIVYPHWGAEYQLTHGASQQSLAHAMIDSGADLVVGSHPHVIQDAELYSGKPIFYSLGNFVFDQLFSKETQQGLVLGVDITRDKLRISLVPVESNYMKPRIATGKLRSEIIDKVLKETFPNQLENGIIELNR